MSQSVNDTKKGNRLLSVISFIEKLAFICNLFFLVCVLLRYFAVGTTITFQGSIIVLGMILSPGLNSLLFFIHLYFLFTAKHNLPQKWLAWVNTMLFIFQVIYLFT